MGDLFHLTHNMCKSLLLLAALVVASSAMYDSWDAIPVSENKEAAPATTFAEESVASLAQEASHLRSVSQAHMALHVERIARHAMLLQGASAEDKAKAYAHNFNNSKNAIRSALKALTSQLNAGHRHDSAALRGEKGRGNRVISNAQTKGRNKCASYRHKACPTKREEEVANKKKDAARRAMTNQGNGKICSGGLSTTFGDMDVEKNVPKFGTELRNKWNRARANYLKHRGKYNAAVKAHRAALKKYNDAMAKFNTALRIEVSNAASACKSAHAEYNALKREVASNVASRKQVFISTLLITCYVDNITSNASAKACADRKRRASTSQWNINGGSLARCPSKAHLTNSMGPASWKPSSRTCHHRHWNAAAYKEKQAKKEKSTKERAKKAAHERGVKRSAKLICLTAAKGSNRAGVVVAHSPGGYTMTGGGLNNHYRSWNKLSAFEEMYPYGNHFRCDTGFGPGRCTCYTRSCKTNVGHLACTTRSTRFRGSGVRAVDLPRGYTMTGGGLYNHYRHFNARAGFEESRPHGQNSWRGDMGFGWGDYTVYVRGCKAPKGHKLNCINRTTRRANNSFVNCPKGYTVTGCGIMNYYRHWNARSGFEQSHPHHNGCYCDSGFGTGDQQCYARCCKLN